MSNWKRKVCVAFLSVLLLCLLTGPVSALSPARPRELPKLPDLPYNDGEINILANVVDGEVGGITGPVRISYADGTVETADACLLHRIHARVVDNQVKSEIFPDTVQGCVRQCWSTAYARTGWRSSGQWQHCRGDVLTALVTDINVPSKVFAATCDPRFAEKYTGFYLWARVDWDTGWCRGTFYYYAYGEDSNDIR